MQRLSKNLIPEKANRPVRVLQFGEGGFLRAFCDWMIDIANEKGTMDTGITIVQPIAKGMTGLLSEQDNLYTLLLRGKENGEVKKDVRVITAINNTINPYEDFDAYLKAAHNDDLRFIISNTTEAGIVYTGTDKYDDKPQNSFPGKVTRFLHERYSAGKNGLIFLPCELIDHNGDDLKDAVLKNAKLWGLDEKFLNWVETENIFTNTLVDRIVTGYPRGEAETIFEELCYEDQQLDVAEPFGLWVIEGPLSIAKELKLPEAGLPVIFTEDVKPYKLRKVRMLNGAHTSMVLAAYLAGFETVGECMADKDVRAYMDKALTNEIMPVINLPKDELQAFKEAIFERFENPFNRHLLLSIALNSVSKFRARVLPTILEYREMRGELPPILTFSMAALIAFYLKADGSQDDQAVLDFFAKKPSVHDILKNESFWGEDLTKVPGFEAAVSSYLELIGQKGAKAAIKEVI
jgi:Mannitol-1-phosphate/altronate dehydrogenases